MTAWRVFVSLCAPPIAAPVAPLFQAAFLGDTGVFYCWHFWETVRSTSLSVLKAVRVRSPGLPGRAVARRAFRRAQQATSAGLPRERGGGTAGEPRSRHGLRLLHACVPHTRVRAASLPPPGHTRRRSSHVHSARVLPAAPGGSRRGAIPVRVAASTAPTVLGAAPPSWRPRMTCTCRRPTS